MRRFFFKAVVGGFAFCLFGTLALAEEQAPLTDKNQPVEITADGALEWRRDEHMYIARDNAVAVRGTLTLKADTLAAHYTDKADGSPDITQLVAEGHVIITSPGQTATGERGVYETASQQAVLTGKNLRLEGNEQVVTAHDSLEWWQAKNLAVARGNAQAQKGENRIAADVLTAHFEPGPDGKQRLKQADASGHVVITTPKDVVRGDAAAYDMLADTAVVTGHVKVSSGNSQMEGARAEVNLKTGVARLVGQGTKGRVRALLAPEDAASKTETKKTKP